MRIDEGRRHVGCGKFRAAEWVTNIEHDRMAKWVMKIGRGCCTECVTNIVWLMVAVVCAGAVCRMVVALVCGRAGGRILVAGQKRIAPVR